MEYECGSFKRNSSVAPFSLFLFFLFLWPLWLFLFISHFSSLGSFNLSSLGSFTHLRATFYILQEYRRSSHFIRSTQHKERMKTIMMYANVCLYQCSRICNDTTTSCSNIKGKLNNHVAPRSSKSIYDMKIKSCDGGCCMAMYLRK